MGGLNKVSVYCFIVGEEFGLGFGEIFRAGTVGRLYGEIGLHIVPLEEKFNI